MNTRISSRLQRRRLGALGLSLTEVMVSGVVGGVIVTSVATINNVSNRTISESGKRELTEVAIDRDLETIRGRMNTYTWCTGAGTLQPNGNGNQCRSNSKAKKSYYYPNNSADQSKFETACNDNSTSNNNLLLASLVTGLSAPALPHPRGATRTVTVSDGTAKRVQVTYTGTGVQTRSVLLTPTVASWCR